MDIINGIIGSSSTSSGSDDGWLTSSAPLQNFNFWLLVEGVMSVPLKSVHAFQKVNQYERIKEGGVNDYVTIKRSPIQEPHQLVVERYMMNSLTDPLANGAELTMPLILAIEHSSKGWWDSSHAARYYAFTGCTVMSKEYGELNAEKSGLATETITIGYKMMYVVPNLLSMGGDPSKAPTTNSNIGEAAVADTINRQLDAQAKEEQDKKDKAAQLADWAKRRANENKSGKVDPTEYGAKVTKDDKGNEIVDWGTPKEAPKEADFFKTDDNGEVQKDKDGNRIPKGNTPKEQAKNKAAYEKQKAEAEASAADIEQRKTAYNDAYARVENENKASNVEERKNKATKAQERRAKENKGEFTASDYEGGKESKDYAAQIDYNKSQNSEAQRRTDEQNKRADAQKENNKEYTKNQEAETKRRTDEQTKRADAQKENNKEYTKNQEAEAKRRTDEQTKRADAQKENNKEYTKNQEAEAKRRADEQKARKDKETKDNSVYQASRKKNRNTSNDKKNMDKMLEAADKIDYNNLKNRNSKNNNNSEN